MSSLLQFVLSQFPARYLADIRFWHFTPELYDSGTFIVRQIFRAIFHNFLFCNFTSCVCLEDDYGFNLLSDLFVGNPDYTRLFDLWMSFQDLLYLPGEYCQSLVFNHVTFSVVEKEIALFIHSGQVAGTKPCLTIN